MKKTKDAVKRQLKEQWRQAVRGYQAALLNMWELDAHYGSKGGSLSFEKWQKKEENKKIKKRNYDTGTVHQSRAD